MRKPNERAVQRRWDWDYPIIARADGIYLWDTDGKRYIDGSGGSSVVTSVGAGVAEIPAAMAKQAEAYSFYPAHVFSNEKLLELCDLIAELAPGELRNSCKIWMTVTGSEGCRAAKRYSSLMSGADSRTQPLEARPQISVGVTGPCRPKG